MTGQPPARQAPPTMADVAAAMARTEARLAVGHETTCRSCGKRTVRIAPPARSLVDDALRFGQPDYAHPGYRYCPGPADDPAARIVRVRP